MTPNDTSLWIVNYKRIQELNSTIDGWLNSFPFEEVNIINNCGTLTRDKIRTDIKINIYHNWHREEWEVGSIAQCWNLCMKKTFMTKDWCVMSQDDVRILPGWADKINANSYLTYIAPAGDVVQIQSLEGFKRVGWFDERFRTIGGPEADYLLRCLQTIPNELSVHDDHIWKLRHNDIGLANHFQEFRTTATLETREGNLAFAQSECFDRWNQKWGQEVDELMCSQNYTKQRNPGWKEIDWYPSYMRKLR